MLVILTWCIIGALCGRTDICLSLPGRNSLHQLIVPLNLGDRLEKLALYLCPILEKGEAVGGALNSLSSVANPGGYKPKLILQNH